MNSLPVGQPSPLSWRSPLRNSEQDYNPDLKRKRSELEVELGVKDGSQPDEAALEKIYGKKLINPLPSDRVDHFFNLRDLIFEIETTMQEIENFDMVSVRSRILSILKQKEYETQMAELGLILFYLDRDKALPEQDSLTAFRAKQMEGEIETYLSIHGSACKNPLVPSGKTTYILRALAHMIITKEQRYNRGGLIAIKVLLMNPHYKISNYLQSEHRHHILAVVEQILRSTKFDILLQKRVSIHPSLQNYIRLDMKLGPDEPIIPAHIIWDCLMALMVDIRQLDAPNCYAISALIYATENNPYKILSQTLEWLERGYVTIGKNNTIPIFPILERRLEGHRNAQTFTMDSQKALSLAPLRHIASTLQLEQAITASKQEIPLTSTLEKLLEENGSAKYLPYAAKLFEAYTYNTLIDMNLALSELTYMNASDASSTESYSYYKAELIMNCVGAIKKDHLKLSAPFFLILERKLGQQLWIENCSEKALTETDGFITVGKRNFSTFTGNHFALTNLFSVSLRVFHRAGDRYVMLDSITALQQVLSNIIIQTVIEIRKKNPHFPGKASEIAQSVKSKLFRIQISNFCSNQIKSSGITGKHLNSADLFILRQVGGREEKVLEMVYGISTSTQKIVGGHTPYQFLEKVLEVLQKFDPILLRKSPKILISTLGKHAWTLTPYCWSRLIENKNNFHNFIQTTVFDPAKRRLSSPIPDETIYRIVDRYTSNDGLRQQLKEYFTSLPASYSHFGADFLQHVDQDTIRLAEEIIEEEYSKIVLTKYQLSLALQELNLRMDSPIFFEMFQKLPSQACYPFQIARELRSSLIEKGIAILDPFEIELALCKAAGLPLPIEVGDLNWIHDKREDPFHLHLMIKYHWSRGVPGYYVRDQERDKLDPYRHLHDCILRHPKVMTRSDLW
jgi:hypothetical protein